jgi:hypothetical protein
LSEAAEKLAKSLALLFAACNREALRPSGVSSDLVEIATGHAAIALDGYADEVARRAGVKVYTKEFMVGDDPDLYLNQEEMGSPGD